MTRLELLSAVGLLVGVALMLSQHRWFARRALADRLMPYSPGGMGRPRRRGLLSVATFGEVVAPLSEGIGAGLARVFGVTEDLERKLRRLHSPLEPTQFRMRQLGFTVVGLIVGVGLSAFLPLAAPLLVLIILGVPLLTFLLLEQQVARASETRQARLFAELPVVAEQLGMLLAAGYSLGGAITRLTSRGDGVVSQDLRVVLRRIRQGVSEKDALREWADLADVESLYRLVAILALNSEGADLATLISDEARSIRREAHRSLVESIERKDQQVWIPVVVAALIPGTILIAVPFVQAMQTFSGG